MRWKARLTGTREHVAGCLEKTPGKRPQIAREIARLFNRCPAASQWSTEEIGAWWLRHERGESASATAIPTIAMSGASPKSASAFDKTTITNIEKWPGSPELRSSVG
jgi:hypothetical protein